MNKPITTLSKRNIANIWLMMSLITIGSALLFSGNVSASTSPGSSVVHADTNNQTFYAYVDDGEFLDISVFRNITPTNLVTVTLEGPGFAGDICTLTLLDIGGGSCDWTNMSADTGVWKVEVTTVSGDNQVDWDIAVHDGISEIDGRVHAPYYQMYQAGGASGLMDFSFWYLGKYGYLYQANYADFQGIYSWHFSDHMGVSHAGTCDSAYRSVQVTDSNYSNGLVSDCGDSYKIFFEEPDVTMPETATLWDGSTGWLYPAIAPDPVVQNITYTPDSSSTRVGTIDYEISDFTGSVLVEIDTNDDGTFDLAIPGSAIDDFGSVDWDGLDSGDNPVSPDQTIHIRVSVTHNAEIHFTQFDVEVRGGGARGNAPQRNRLTRDNAVLG